MKTYLTKRWGDGVENPSEGELRSALAELAQADGEHPNAWLADEEEWTVDVYEGALVLFYHAENEGAELEKEYVTADESLVLWQMLQKGERDNIKQWLSIPSAKTVGNEPLFDKTPQEILSLLPSVLSHAENKEVSRWHDNAGAACYRAHRLAGKDAVTASAWASVSVKLDEWIIEHAPTQSMRESVTLSLLIFRITIMRKLGPMDGHPALDPHHVTQWFLSTITIPIDHVRDLSVLEMFKLPQKQFNELREIKQRLQYINQLGEICPVPDMAEIQPWIEFAKRFPC